MDATSDAQSPNLDPPVKRRRGSRGGRSRSQGQTPDSPSTQDVSEGNGRAQNSAGPPGMARAPRPRGDNSKTPDELPERTRAERPRSTEAAEKALVRRPQIGDSMPAPEPAQPPLTKSTQANAPRGKSPQSKSPQPKSPQPKSPQSKLASPSAKESPDQSSSEESPSGRSSSGQPSSGQPKRRRSGRSRSSAKPKPVEATVTGGAVELDTEELKRRKGRSRKGKPVGRYLMTVNVRPQATQIAVLEGRNLIEHYVSRPSDDVTQIHGNIYLGRVQNVLPGMEAAFVDIGTPKNAVLYRGDVQYDAEDIEENGENPRIEELLKPKQTILCQVTKNPIAHKGARLTQEVSLPGRFVVLIPNSSTYGISKRLADDERKRLRKILDAVKPEQHGIIVRTAAERITAEEIEADVRRLIDQWNRIEALAKSVKAPTLLYREPDMAVRVIREEFNVNYRGIVIDNKALFEEVHSYVSAISPALAERVQFYDPSVEPLSIFEQHHVHVQLHKALDRKVWLPSGGSLIIEHTEALTVIDVNTGKNVGTSSLEETVFKNNLEAAVEVAKQLRLRDVGGIIVIDFIDMEIRENREEVIRTFRDALARDKTRTQVFDISELGLVEMTRKRIGEGLLESFSSLCPECEGRGVQLDQVLLD